MTWSSQSERIRRFLRDPNNDIWSNRYLLRMFNDEQNDIQNSIGQIEDVRVVLIPSVMQTAYIYDWEWTETNYSDGEVFQPGYYNDTHTYVCTNIWEHEHLKSVTPTTSSHGDFFTQPWEAWMVSTPCEPPPISFPDGCHNAKFVAWDRKPVEPVSLKELQDNDITWKTRSGDPVYYYRDETLSNKMFLYPLPSSVTWPTSYTAEDLDPDESEYGSSTLDVDDNLLIIFDKNATDLEVDTDSPVFPDYFHKYIEYGVISRAYGANTDGRIRSLSDYWDLRKQVGIKAMKRFLLKRRTDRNYRLQPTFPRPVRSRSHPRLPSEYPDI